VALVLVGRIPDVHAARGPDGPDGVRHHVEEHEPLVVHEVGVAMVATAVDDAGEHLPVEIVVRIAEVAPLDVVRGTGDGGVGAVDLDAAAHAERRSGGAGDVEPDALDDAVA
jgi:hypothetical protein